MKVGKRITHHVNMGNYEWVEFSAHVEVDVDDDEKWPGVKASDKLDEILSDVLFRDMETAEDRTKEKSTYIENWGAELRENE